MSTLKTIKDRSIYDVKTEEFRPPSYSSRRRKIERFAKLLNRNISKEEQWFRDLYQAHIVDFHIPRHNDQYNKPIKVKYICTIVNYKYMYVIDLEGEHFNEETQIPKESYLRRKGFKVFRIKAFDLNNYYRVIKELLEYRASKRISST